MLNPPIFGRILHHTLLAFVLAAAPAFVLAACSAGPEDAPCASTCAHIGLTCPNLGGDGCESYCKQDFEHQGGFDAPCGKLYNSYLACVEKASLECMPGALDLPLDVKATGCDAALNTFLSSCPYPGGE